jgi:hypothetical protein
MREAHKVPRLALAGLPHLGVARRSAFLVELGAAMMVASTIVPALLQDAADLGEDGLAQVSPPE